MSATEQPAITAQITVFRDITRDLVIEEEREFNPDNPFDITARRRLVAPLEVPVNTPQGIIRVPVRCPLDGAQNVVDAFARFKEIVDKNLPPIMEVKLAQMKAEMQRASLRTLPPGMPPR